METIKYYDTIHNKYIDLEVNDEVAQFLRSDNKRLKRQQKRDRQYIAISLDEQTDYSGEEALTYHEIIADENAYIEKNLEKKEFAKCIWRVVDELEDNQAKIIKGYYKYGYKNKELASYLKMSTSAFCQFKATALKHLHILLSFDPEFSNTNFCYNYKYDEYVFVDDIGDLINPDIISNRFRTLLRKNNLKHIRFHDLRHSCASLLVASKVPMKNIQEWLGHSNFNTTADVYSHLDYSSKYESANAINQALTQTKKRKTS